MGKNTKIVGGVLLVAIILVAVAYAAITNVELNINGVGSAQAKQENFKVEFIGTPSTSGKGTTTATISESDKTKGTVNVTGLTAKGDEATATYTVKNQSSDISADLTAEATSSNQTYFEVICSLEKTTLKAQEETTLKVTVRLLKTPIDETKEDLNSDIDVTLTADPKQPGEETNGGSTSVSSNETRPYLPTGFTQVKGTTLKNGLTIQDSTGNQYVWVEVPKTGKVYPTAGLNITEFTTDEYTAIEADLHTYTNYYRNGTRYKDEYYSDATTGLKSEQYTELKQKNIDTGIGLERLAVVVQDVDTHVVLMLAYMNEEAWKRTLETGEAHYWSRSRKELWHKGGTSGNVQKVLSIRLDCDSDTVLLKIEQIGGAACHTGRRSCFYREWDNGVVRECSPVVFDPRKVYGAQ